MPKLFVYKKFIGGPQRLYDLLETNKINDILLPGGLPKTKDFILSQGCNATNFLKKKSAKKICDDVNFLECILQYLKSLTCN